MRLWLAIATLGVAGCSSGSYGAKGSTNASGADQTSITEDSTPTSTGTDTAGLDLIQPSFLTIEGTIAMLSGAPDPLTSELRVTGLDPAQTEICATLGPPASFTAVDPIPASLIGWWDVAVAEDPGCLVPVQVRIGIGPYDTLLDPAALAADIGGTPYGLYAAGPADELWIFGVAGTQDNYDGLLAPVAVGPLPDGAYRLESLLLLPL